MAEFFEVVHRQRACREFSSEPLSDELIETLLEAATFAPSAENRQPWVFVVVRDEARRAALGELNRRAWESGGRRYSEGRLDPAMLAEVDRGALGGVASAPVLVVVCGDTEAGNARVIEASIYPATQNLLLAATALGLGSALTTLPLLYADEMATLLELPAHVRPLAVVPLGHPVTPPGRPRRQPVAAKAHRDRYGRAW